jgi:putative aldouronate transport system substrate-binding protein
MKSNNFKVFCLFLIILMLIGSFAACKAENTQGPDSATTPKPTEEPAKTPDAVTKETATPVPEVVPGWQIDTTPITFDAYVNLSWFTEKWTTDEPTRTTSYVTNKTGVSFNWLTPTGNESERMITMIASGDLPDLVFSDLWDVNNDKMIEAGHFQPLNKLADEYDKAFYDVVKPSQIGWYTREDGNIYDYPNFANAYENVKDLPDKSEIGGDCALAVRKDIYEAIGSPDMTTPEGFLDALVKAKEQFPEVGGYPLIPIHMEFNEYGCTLVNNYLPQLLALPKDKDGKLYDNYTDPDFITWLKTLRKANELGLISKDVFIEQRAQTEEKILGGRYFVVSRGKSDLAGANNNLYTANKDNGMYYIPLDAMRNSKGDDPKISGKIMMDGWMNIHITSKCKDPARAIRFLNYAMGPEGQHDLWFGEEGVIYDMVNGKEVIKPELLDGTVSAEDLTKKYYGWGSNWTFYNSDITLTFPKQDAPYTPTEDFKIYTGKYFYPVPEFSNTTLDPSSDVGIASTNISILWGETLPQLILAETEEAFDQLYDNFLTARTEMGYESVQAAIQEKVDVNKVKLGLD